MLEKGIAMRVRRLGWAGVEVEEDGVRIAIDAIGTLGFFEEFWGPEDQRDELVRLDVDSLDGALVTHLHRDHTDPEALAAALKPDAPVAGPGKPRHLSQLQQFAVGQVEEELSVKGVDRGVFAVGESLQIGPFTVVACPSCDGVGADQVAWLIKSGTGSLLHCGDTVWHGYWWDVTDEHGAPDVVCLPANSPEIDFLVNVPPVDQPACLSPEQAVDAAYALKAGALLPIHFSRTYEHERMYRPVADAEDRLRAAAATREVEPLFPAIGEWLQIESA
jgi:L-ascorbate metabolism protein UlaG (beta-lactamase superfamily)